MISQGFYADELLLPKHINTTNSTTLGCQGKINLHAAIYFSMLSHIRILYFEAMTHMNYILYMPITSTWCLKITELFQIQINYKKLWEELNCISSQFL